MLKDYLEKHYRMARTLATLPPNTLLGKVPPSNSLDEVDLNRQSNASCWPPMWAASGLSLFWELLASGNRLDMQVFFLRDVHRWLWNELSLGWAICETYGRSTKRCGDSSESSNIPRAKFWENSHYFSLTFTFYNYSSK